MGLVQIHANMTPRQVALRYAKATTIAVTQGLGKKTFGRWWSVYESDWIRFSCQGKLYFMYGFTGLERVYSVFHEEDDRIIARFFTNEQEEQAGVAPLKTAVFAQKKEDSWQLLKTPEIIQVQGTGMQAWRVECRQLNRFLLSDAEEGAFFDLKPNKSTGGAIALRADTKEGAYILICKFKAYEGQIFYGRVVVQGDEKKVFFWKTEQERTEGMPAILSEGTVIAQKNGEWKIIWRQSDLGYRINRANTFKYGNYLFASVGAKQFFIEWTSVGFDFKQGGRKRAFKEIRGEKMFLELPADFEGKVYSRTRELCGKAKVIEFWLNEEACLNREPAYVIRFITLRTNGEWAHFWANLGQVAKFRKILEQGAISKEDLKRVFSDYFFRLEESRYREAYNLMQDLGLLNIA